jgi:hypothetical protein
MIAGEISMASRSWRRILRHIGVGCAVMLSVATVRITEAQAQAGSSFGVQVQDPSTGNDCIAGSCSAHQPLPFGGSASAPYTTQRSFPNGDSYQIDGMIGIALSADGTGLTATMFFTVTFLSGPGTGSTSVGEPDTFVLYNFFDWTQNGNTNRLTTAAVGQFSSGVGSQSAVTVQASYCGGATTSALLGPFSPPGSYSNTTLTTVPPCPSGGLLQNDIYTISFRSGTQPGSYIQAGNVSAPFSTGVATHDSNGDLYSDIVWRSTNGALAVWLMNGGSVLLASGIAAAPTGTWAIVGQRDFNGDGKADFLWRDGSGNTAIWFLDAPNILSNASLGNIPSTWTVIATGDFNGDGYGDILWRDGNGNVAMWLMNGSQVLSATGLGVVPLTFTVVGSGDFDGNRKTDLLWRDGSGGTYIWLMNGTQVSSVASLGTVSGWSVVAVGDFNGDGKSDIAWHDAAGDLAIWLMNGTQVSQNGGVGNVPSPWTVISTGDYNGDGKSDLLWQDSSGDTVVWFMNGLAVSSTALIGTISPTVWTVQTMNAN